MNVRSPALVQLRKTLLDQRADAFEGLVKLAPKANKSPQAAEEFEFAAGRCLELDQRLERFSAIHITEPDIYHPGGQHSFVRDLAAVATHSSDMFAAQERLQRHHDQADDRGVSQMISAQSRGVIFSNEYEQRALSLTLGDGGEFSPPDYMTSEFASIARSASPLLRALPSTPLPPKCSEIYVPRVTSSGGVVAMSNENVTPPQTWSGTDQIAVPIALFAGEVILSQQLFERGPSLDRYLVQDFGAAAAAAFENQIINGTGADGQVLGLLNLPTNAVDGVPGANLVTWTQASPTPEGLVGQIGVAFADIGNTRLRPPSVAVMTAERYAWVAANKDSQDEPIMRPGTGLVPGNSDTGEWGPIAGLPVLLSGEIPQDLGAGSDQDTVIVTRTADFLWLPSDPVFDVYVDTAGGPAQLAVAAAWHVYAALVSARYPSGTATIQGTGLVRSGLTWPS